MNLETTLQNETVLRVFFLLLLLLPIVLCALAVWRWRGSLRVLAAILLAVQGMGLATGPARINRQAERASATLLFLLYHPLRNGAESAGC